MQHSAFSIQHSALSIQHRASSIAHPAAAAAAATAAARTAISALIQPRHRAPEGLPATSSKGSCPVVASSSDD
ncbi:hypothetical protein N9L68_03410 [bacterium]|nr:hypothetical protein [bacterium]